MPGAKKKREPELVPQQHGGALLTGGVPGNKGGSQPPSKIREAMRRSFAERIPLLEAIADDPEERTFDRLRAIEILGKYALPTLREVSGPDGGAIENHHMINQIDLEKVRERFEQKIQRLAERRLAEAHALKIQGAEHREPKQIEPGKRAPGEEEPPPRSAPDPDSIIAVFEDRPTPQPREVEIQEPIVEKSGPVRLPAPSRNSWGNGPGRPFIRGGYD